MNIVINKVLPASFAPGIDWRDFVAAWLQRELLPGEHPLRFNLAGIDGDPVDLSSGPPTALGPAAGGAHAGGSASPAVGASGMTAGNAVTIGGPQFDADRGIVAGLLMTGRDILFPPEPAAWLYHPVYHDGTTVHDAPKD